MGEASQPMSLDESSQSMSYFEYNSVAGFFKQDDPNTDTDKFQFMKENFGLIEQEYDTDITLPNERHGLTSWQRFEHKLATMNKGEDKSTSYRLLFLGRHGEGYHNVAESYYGTEMWDCYYASLDGDPNGTMVWADAHLTQTGIQQAREVNSFWTSQIQNQKMPTPQSFYVSPLDRTLQTAELTFKNLKLLTDRPYRPHVKELVREAMGVHTCDRRSNKTYIEQNYPDYKIEASFTDQDELWLPDLRESDSAHEIRLLTFLDDIFHHDESTWISMTSHSGTIAAILRVVGHRNFNLMTGAVIPVLVQVKKVQGRRPEKNVQPWMPMPECLDGSRAVFEKALQDGGKGSLADFVATR